MSNKPDLDPRLEIESVWQRITDWDDVHALKLIHDHLVEMQMIMMHRMYLLFIDEASPKNKKKKLADAKQETQPDGDLDR
jgi:hypothetical protein